MNEIANEIFGGKKGLPRIRRSVDVMQVLLASKFAAVTMKLRVQSVSSAAGRKPRRYILQSVLLTDSGAAAAVQRWMRAGDP